MTAQQQWLKTSFQRAMIITVTAKFAIVVIRKRSAWEVRSTYASSSSPTIMTPSKPVRSLRGVCSACWIPPALQALSNILASGFSTPTASDIVHPPGRRSGSSERDSSTLTGVAGEASKILRAKQPGVVSISATSHQDLSKKKENSMMQFSY